jgi:hypothetical protein
MTETAGQPSLFDGPRGTENEETIDARFAAFDAAHPEVWDLFRRFAGELLASGRERYSADAILHRVRWHYAVNAERDEGFKINDHFSSRYARKLRESDERFADFFEFRRLRTA